MKRFAAIPRMIRVGVELLPFLVSFIRDWRSFLVAGGPRRLTPAQHQRRAEALSATMGRLGAAFIKGGQVLAMREDVLPPVYCRALRKLQDAAPPFPPRQVAATIRANLGKAPGRVFEHFDPKPIAAASIGQVHRALYKGRPVAVKVLRPGIEEQVETDLRVVFFLLFLLQLFVDDNLLRSFHAVIAEYSRMMRQEMDLRNERRNAERLRRNFRQDPRIRIPHFHEELLTRQVAVLEFIDGVRVDDAKALASVGMQPRDLVELLIETYVRMAVVHGFIHADPHPGNLLLDRQGRLVLLDFGMALEFDEATRLELLKMVYAVTRKDVDTIVEGFYRLGMADPDINRGTLRDAAQKLLDIQLEQDLTPRQIQEIAQQILDTFYRFPLRLPNQLVYLFRASSLIEGIAIYYNPRFNAVKEATPLVKRLLGEIAFQGEKPFAEWAQDVARDAYVTMKELVFIIHRLEREQLRLRLHEADLFDLQRYLMGLVRRLMGAILLAALLLLGGGYLVLHGSPVLAAVLVLVLALAIVVLALVPVARGRGGPYFK